MSSAPQTVTKIYDAEHRMPPIRPYLEETFGHLQFALQKAPFST